LYEQGHVARDVTEHAPVQLEVAFDSIAELDSFWSAIPPERHRAWSQRAQHVIIDGSPQVVLQLPGHHALSACCK
jgi:hypothetical protein